MKANVSYDDLIGTAAADIANLTTKFSKLSELSDFFKLDNKKYKLVGISVYGASDFNISLLCVDLTKSTDEQEYLVSIMVNHNYPDILTKLFERFHVVLFEKHNTKYSDLKFNEGVSIDLTEETEEDELS